MTWYLKTELGSTTSVQATWYNPNATFEELRAVCNDMGDLPNKLTFNWEPRSWQKDWKGVYKSDGWSIFKDEAHKAATWCLANPNGKIVDTFSTLKAAKEAYKAWLPKPLEGPKGGGG